MEAPKTNPAAAESKLHFLDYWRIIRIRMTVILAVFLLVALTTTAVTFMLPKKYMSSVRLEVTKDNSTILPLLGIRADTGFDPYFMENEFNKIQSSMILDPVVGPKDEKTGLGLDLVDVWAKRYGVEGKLKTQEARQILLKEIDVRQYRNTSLIEIRVRDEDPKLAASIADQIALSYQGSRVTRKHEQSDEGIRELEIMKLKEDGIVTNLEAKVDGLRKQYKISDYESGTGMPSALLEPETVRDLERERLGAMTAYIQGAQLLRGLTNVTNEEELRQTLPTAVGDDGLSKLLRDLAEVEQKWVALTNEFTPENRQLMALADVRAKIGQQIDDRVKGILTGLKTTVATSYEKMVAMSNQVDEAKSAESQKVQQAREYFQARRDLETEQKIRDNLVFRIMQEQIDSALVKPDAIVLITDKAEVASNPVLPNVPLNIALGIIVGLIMGVGLAFFIEYLDTSVKTIDDVERSLQAPVLGVIPQNVGMLLDEGPESPHAEAYRVLRTNLLFSRKDPKLNGVTVVSGGAGEGKSTTIFNLATIFAQCGERVLIVDSDLRRPSLHKFLNVSNAVGLTNLLLKQNTLEEVIQTTNMPTLHFLPSGKLPSSSLGILNSVAMREFIKEAKSRYDFVFFDSPPIMGVSDASVLASEVDLSLLVVQYRKYPQVMTVRAKQTVEKVGGTLLGVVLNNINISQDSYYYYYSGYYYDYYSKHDDDSSSKNGGAKKPSAGRGGVELKQKF